MKIEKWCFKPKTKEQCDAVRNWTNQFRTIKYWEGKEEDYYWHYPKYDREEDFCWIKIADGYTEVDYDQWKELTAPALPEKWFIRFNTPEQAKVIIEYFATLHPQYKNWVYTGADRFFSSDGDYGIMPLSTIIERGYTEISFETFQSQVLNQTNMAQVSVGSSSKALKRAFLEEIQQLGLNPMGGSTNEVFVNGLENTEYFLKNEGNACVKGQYMASSAKARTHYDLATQWDSAVEAFKPEETLPAVGEYGICLEGFQERGGSVSTTGESKYGGSGYRAGKVFRVKRISEHNRTSSIFWPAEGGCGIYSWAVRKATSAEVDAYFKVPQEEILDIEYEDGTFEVTVRKGAIEADEEVGTRDDLVALIGQMENAGDLLGEWAINFEFVSLGCKHNIPIGELKRIVAEYDKINN